MRFKNRVAIVTASAGAGIGKATVEAFAREGANIVVSDTHEKRTIKVAEELSEKYGVEALPIACDVSQKEQIDALVEKTIDKFGRIDILVNNAGRETLAPAKDLTNEQWRMVVGVCLDGTFMCTRAVLPQMIKQNFGRLIHLSSVAGFLGADDGQSHYCAAKAGILGFSRAVAAENAKYDITSNCIAPGLIMNEFLKRIYPEDALKAMVQMCPKGRAGIPDDIANGVLFYAQENSGFITGDIMTISGGLYMHA